MSASITSEIFRQLTSVADESGLLRFSWARLDDPRLGRSRAAFESFLSQGHHGEMDFLANTKQMRDDAELLLTGVRTALVAVMAYGGVEGPIARYAQWADYHTIVHRRLEAVVARLSELVPEAATKICVDTKPVPERALAILAGIGFQGKNGCLIVPGLGSYVVIGTILTTATVEMNDARELPRKAVTSSSMPWDACGSCRACLDACPTDAFVGPARLDARKCISYLTIEHRGEIEDDLAARIGLRVAGCDVCQEVCPHNASPGLPKKTESWQRLPAVPGDRNRALSLAQLANVGNNQHKGLVKHSALNRIPRRALRRNALIALGNVEGPLTAEEDLVLQSVVDGDDPELRAWASKARDRRGPAASSS